MGQRSCSSSSSSSSSNSNCATFALSDRVANRLAVGSIMAAAAVVQGNVSLLSVSMPARAFATASQARHLVRPSVKASGISSKLYVAVEERSSSGQFRTGGIEVLAVAATAFAAVTRPVTDGRGRRVGRRGTGRGDSMVQSDSAETKPSVDGPSLEMMFNERAQDSLMKVGKEHKAPVTKWNDQDWRFFDVAMIYVQGGDGGHGCNSFRHELFREFGGPDGGSGGHGGHVFLQCVSGMTHLMELKRIVHYKAKKGYRGEGKELDGKCGEHRIVPVPPGTCVYVRDAWVQGQPTCQSAGQDELVMHEDISTRHFVGELTQIGQMMRVARGGRGGRGNRSFKTHSNTAPRISEAGSPGLGRWLEIEMKMMADIGIIGVPNAGKSSFLSAVTKKEAKIAAYPFTTIVPNVGTYVANNTGGGLTLCDVPGLIDGAHEGRGMGIQFLRHIERCHSLIHVVSAHSDDPLRDFDLIQEELREYSTEVALKPQVVLVNKVDIPEVQEFLPELMKALRKRCGHSRVFDISVATRYHIDESMRRIYKWHSSLMKAEWEKRGAPSQDAEHVVDMRHLVQLGAELPQTVTNKEEIELDPDLWVRGHKRKNTDEPRLEWDVLEGCWRIRHPELERIAKFMNWGQEDAHDRFNRISKAVGMTDLLKLRGLAQGEPVIVQNHKFSYQPEMAEGVESRMLIYEMDLDF